MTRTHVVVYGLVVMVMVAFSSVLSAQPLVTGDLSIYYSFDEFVDEVPDLSGNPVPINGEVVGNVRHTADGVRGGAAEFFPDPPDFVPENYFDLNGPMVTDELPERIPTEALTVAMWVNVKPTIESQATYSPWSSNGAFVTHFEFRPDGQYRMTLRGQSQSEEAVEFIGFDPDFEGWTKFSDNDEWFHVAGTYDSNANGGDGQWAYYVNGEEIASDIANGNAGAIELGDWGQGANLGRDPDEDRQFNGRMDEFYLFARALTAEEIVTLFQLKEPDGPSELQAGDADMDLDFDQLDLVQVQIAAKYLTGNPASWGEGDWNGAPGGSPGAPPVGDGLFDQRDVIAALAAGKYLTGPYAAIQAGGQRGDAQASVLYNANTGEVAVDAPAGTELTSINIDSAAGVLTGDPAENLGGSFDHDADNSVFKATFGASFGSISFGRVAQAGLSEQFVLGDLTVVGSLAGGGDLGPVDLIYVPEPAALVLLGFGMLGAGLMRLRRRQS